MSFADFEKKLLADQLGLSEQEFEDRFAALCRRLGVSGLAAASSRWSGVVFRLIKQQPEFKKSKRGRPKLGQYGGGTNYERAKAVNALRREKIAAGKKGRITDKQLAEELTERGDPLFRKIDDPTKSVSRGQKIFRAAQAEVHRLRAESKRRDAQLRRQQKRREEAFRERMAKSDGPVGLLSLNPPFETGNGGDANCD